MTYLHIYIYELQLINESLIIEESNFFEGLYGI
jgi:hypothetical protein